jgi:nitric oxide reductase NorQ protein
VLIKKGVEPRRACEVALIKPITDDVEIQRILKEIVTAVH